MAASRVLRPMRNIVSASTRFHSIAPSHTPFSQRILPIRRFTTQPRQQREYDSVEYLGAAPAAPPLPFEVPSLGDYDAIYKEEGIAGVLSAEGYRIAWLDYQKHLGKKLRALTAGETIENMALKDIVVQFARDPAYASVFNHASMLLNNHMFIQSFSTSPRKLSQQPGLERDLTSAFGSIENLRSSMIESAAGMFGPGFTWLVYNTGPSGTPSFSAMRGRKASDREAGWRILNTYNAGTPFGEAGYRRQSIDVATNNVGTMGSYSAAGRQQAEIPPGATRLLPVLCVNTWEHAWLYDYGVAGKREFLNKWWDAIDWSRVDSHLGTIDATRHIAQSSTERIDYFDNQKRESQGTAFHE